MKSRVKVGLSAPQLVWESSLNKLRVLSHLNFVFRMCSYQVKQAIVYCDPQELNTGDAAYESSIQG